MRFGKSPFLLVSALALTLILPVRQASAAARKQTQTAAPTQQQAPQQQEQAQQPGYAISVTVPVVSVDVVVTDNDGNYVTGLKKENFHLTEDGATQTITNFSTGEAPITVVMLLEFSQRGYYTYLINARNWADVFLHFLKPTDWIALESFSLTPNVEVDFTHNPSEIEQGLLSMTMPPFEESALFDAVTDTVNRLQDVKGKKAVLVLASGTNTISKLTLDKVLNRLRQTDVTIFCVGVGENFYNQMDMYNAIGPIGRLDYMQAQNQLRQFSALTGGRAWFPDFNGEIPGVMSDVAASLRNQYSLAYTTTNQSTDGKYRKIKIDLVAADGTPFVMLDAKGKKKKFVVYARQGYTAPTSAAGN